MKKSFFWSLAFYDWNSTFKALLLILFLAVSLFVMFNISYFGMLLQSINKDKEVNGWILERTPEITVIQTRIQGNVSTKNYLHFKYRYQVKGLYYLDSCRLSYSLLNAASLNKIQSEPLPVSVKIKYNSNHPYRSVIWIP